MKNGAASAKTVCPFLKMLNIGLPCDPAVTLLGMRPEEKKTCPHKSLHTSVDGSIIHNSPKVETTQISTNGQMDKQSVAYTYNGELLSNKKMNYW